MRNDEVFIRTHAKSRKVDVPKATVFTHVCVTMKRNAEMIANVIVKGRRDDNFKTSASPEEDTSLLKNR